MGIKPAPASATRGPGDGFFAYTIFIRGPGVNLKNDYLSLKMKKVCTPLVID